MQIKLAKPVALRRRGPGDRPLTALWKPRRRFMRHEVVHNKFVVEDLRTRRDRRRALTRYLTTLSSSSVPMACPRRAYQRPAVALKCSHLPAGDHGAHRCSVIASRRSQCILISHAGHPSLAQSWASTIQRRAIYLVEDEKRRYTCALTPDRLAFASAPPCPWTIPAASSTPRCTRFRGWRPPHDIRYADKPPGCVKQLADEMRCSAVVGSPNSSNSNWR